MQAESTIAGGIDQGARHVTGSDSHLVATTVPPRSRQQRRAALDRANEIRSHRAQLKRKIKTGDRAVPAILLDPYAEVATMKVYDLMLAMPKVGRVKANKLLQNTRVAPSKTIGGLTERQRVEIVGVLLRYHPRPQLFAARLAEARA